MRFIHRLAWSTSNGKALAHLAKSGSFAITGPLNYSMNYCSRSAIAAIIGAWAVYIHEKCIPAYILDV